MHYVVRHTLTSFKNISEIENIVDEAVREKVREAVDGKDFKKAIAEPIYMNKEKGILINKVRCFVPSVKSPLNIRRHRDQSTKEYKHQFHVANDSNYCMAIYEGTVNGKKKRGFKIVNMLEASAHFKWSNNERDNSIVPTHNEYGLTLKFLLTIGMQVILQENMTDIQSTLARAEALPFIMARMVRTALMVLMVQMVHLAHLAKMEKMAIHQ